jgi:hypothetical protein
MQASSPYNEILAVLEAGMECAGSLRTKADEAEKLLELGEIEDARACYAARGEVLSMMSNLDSRLVAMMNAARPSLSGKEWGHLVELGSKLHEELAIASQTDERNVAQIKDKSQLLSVELNRLKHGRQMAQSYQSPRQAKAQYQA